MSSIVERIAHSSGINLKKARKKYGIKLVEYAEKCRISKRYLSCLIRYLIVKLAEVEEKR